jgi:hypothetical protein
VKPQEPMRTVAIAAGQRDPQSPAEERCVHMRASVLLGSDVINGPFVIRSHVLTLHTMVALGSRVIQR